MFAEPVAALCHAAAIADLVVLGGRYHSLPWQGTAARLATRLAERKARGRTVPLIVMASAAGVLAPPPRPRDRARGGLRLVPAA